MGGRGSSSGMGSGVGAFRSGQKYTNGESNVFIKRVDYEKGTVRFIDGYSPSAVHDTQEIPASELKKYLKRWGFKSDGYYE